MLPILIQDFCFTLILVQFKIPFLLFFESLLWFSFLGLKFDAPKFVFLKFSGEGEEERGGGVVKLRFDIGKIF